MKVQEFHRGRGVGQERGFTLLELMIATAILVVLSTLAVPMARSTITREKERELRNDLWEMRDAIDRYKDAADRHAFQTKVDSQNYPPDLETLVKGVDVQGRNQVSAQDSDRSHDRHARSGVCVRCRTIRIRTPAAGRACSTSTPSRRARALDGTKYKDW